MPSSPQPLPRQRGAAPLQLFRAGGSSPQRVGLAVSRALRDLSAKPSTRAEEEKGRRAISRAAAKGEEEITASNARTTC